jgi:hypothetical protein
MEMPLPDCLSFVTHASPESQRESSFLTRENRARNRRFTAPDDAVFQSWNDYPTHFLPETQPGTLTGVVTQTVGSRQP